MVLTNAKNNEKSQNPVYFCYETLNLQSQKIIIYLAMQYAKFVDKNFQIFSLEKKTELLQHFLQHSATIKQALLSSYLIV